MAEAEMDVIAGLIVEGVAARGDSVAQDRVRAGVAEIVDRYPVPGLPWTVKARTQAASPAR